MSNLIKNLLAVSVVLLSATTSAQAIQTTPEQETALKTCMAATWDAQQAQKAEKSRKRGPVRRAVRSTAKFIGDEVNATAQGVGRDLVLALSVQENDPYEGKPPTNKPYLLTSFRLVDGSMCNLMKYPDGSGRVNGSFADGTIMAPIGQGKFLVGYPNGARGMLEKSGTKVKVYRPDKTVTTFEKTPSGNWKIHNSELGYMGEGLSDQTGLRFDFGSFGSGTL